MDIYASTEKYIIIASNEVMLDSQDTFLDVPIGKEEIIGTIRIRFDSEIVDEQKPDLQVKNTEEGLEIFCKGFNNEFGSFTTKPMQIGELNDKALLMHIFSSLAGNGEMKLRTVKYTIFEEK